MKWPPKFAFQIILANFQIMESQKLTSEFFVEELWKQMEKKLKKATHPIKKWLCVYFFIIIHETTYQGCFSQTRWMTVEVWYTPSLQWLIQDKCNWSLPSGSSDVFFHHEDHWTEYHILNTDRNFRWLHHITADSNYLPTVDQRRIWEIAWYRLPWWV